MILIVPVYFCVDHLHFVLVQVGKDLLESRVLFEQVFNEKLIFFQGHLALHKEEEDNDDVNRSFHFSRPGAGLSG